MTQTCSLLHVPIIDLTCCGVTVIVSEMCGTERNRIKSASFSRYILQVYYYYYYYCLLYTRVTLYIYIKKVLYVYIKYISARVCVYRRAAKVRHRLCARN